MEYLRGKRFHEYEPPRRLHGKKNKLLPKKGELNQFSPISNLPDEVTLKIFKFLESKDLHFKVVLVNEKWYSLTHEKCFAPKELTLSEFDTKIVQIHNAMLLNKFKGFIPKITLRNSSKKVTPWWHATRVTNLLESCERLRELRIEMNLISVEHLQQLLTLLTAHKNTLKVLKIQFFTGTEKLTVKLKACLEQIFQCMDGSTITVFKLHMDTILTIDRSLPLPFPNQLKKLEVKFTGHHQSSNFVKLFVAANQSTLAHLSIKCKLDAELIEAIRKCEVLKYFSFTKFPVYHQSNEKPQPYEIMEPLEFEQIKLQDVPLNGRIEKGFKQLKYFQNATSLALNIVEFYKVPLKYNNYSFPFVSELSLSGDSTEETYYQVASMFPQLKVLKIVLDYPDYEIVNFLDRAMERLPLALMKLKYFGPERDIDDMTAAINSSQIWNHRVCSLRKKFPDHEWYCWLVFTVKRSE